MARPIPRLPRLLGREHGLQLSVLLIELLQRSDGQELTIEAEAEERDGVIEKGRHVKRVHVFGRTV